MNPTAISQYIVDTFDGVDVAVSSGDSFFMYDPSQRFPFATLVTDDHYDDASNLSRPGVFRLNIGVGRETYRALFGPQPARLGEAGIVDTGHDFTALDTLLPHPVYAPQFWICVLNPSVATFESVKSLLAEAFALSVKWNRKSITKARRAAES